ncbi:alpha-L-fucosidase [Dysgonomonas sp. ZJ709]|uniref:alpha-L-fucosidase n=1 Tax=Dysgonomonas sp. ZJ709 TaxID=2709797 RepID=UPI0013EAB048|nr:alpha-L-fucosidase [Dysgonomonas sp. ZJ709]
MKNKLLILGSVFIWCFSSIIYAQTYTHGRSETYILPKDPAVLEKLDQWQDQKFGMLIHYGLYAQLGIVESWSICSEDWITRDTILTYDQDKRKYWGTIDEFNPTKLDPESWAESGKKAGMKYVVFTTKHHDGFNMFDTKYSDFSITKGAFKNHPRKNIAKEVFNAFRNEGYMIGAYYSKPDWHSQNYWWDKYATPNRNNNYNIKTNPDRWNKFKQYTYNQIEELMNGDYGSMDILWLDGGWVRPARPGDAEKYGEAYMGEQDIDMPRIAAMARSHQPGLLVVDRTVPGEYENYQTPERGIPDTQLSNPWESCITLGYAWSWTPRDKYKSPSQVIHILVEIVAKGGNLLLGIGPHPDGTLPEDIKERLEKIGTWTSKNKKAIYGTRITPNYNSDKTWFTQSKDAETIYAITCLEEGQPLPKKIVWKGNNPIKGSKVIFVETGKAVNWKQLSDGSIEVVVPNGLPQDQPALSFSFKPEGK